MQYLQNTKLCTQILCFMFILMIFCFGIFIGIININFYFLEGFIINSSQTILNKQFKTETKALSFFSKQLIERYQQREAKRLESVNKIYQFTWDNQLFYENNAESCLNTFISQFSGLYSMCYGIQNNKADLKNTNFQEYLKIVNLFSLTWLMSDNKFEILFAGSTEEKFIALWPRIGIVQFDPQSRPWYKLQTSKPFIKKYQTYYTKPYSHSLYNGTTISHTQDLYSQDFDRIGVVAIQLNFTTTFPYFLQDNKKITGYIVNEDYIILQMKGKYSSIISFFNSSITGFDENQKTALINYINQNQINQYCQNLNEELLCLKNIYNKEFIVEAQQFNDQKKILILVFDPANDFEIQNIRTNDLYVQVRIQNNNIIVQSIILYFSVISLTLIITYKITTKISKITYQAQILIFQQHKKVIQLNYTIQQNNQDDQNCLEQLEQALFNLNEKMKYNLKLNPQCQLLSNFCPFPKLEQLNYFFLSQSIDDIHNVDYCLPKLKVKQIINDTKSILKKQCLSNQRW